MKYFVESYGCTMNRGEGDEFSRILRNLGHIEASSPEDADLVVLNTCTVVDTTEKHMLKRMSQLKSLGKETIVTGCMAKVQSGRVSIRLPDAEILPPDLYELFEGKILSKYGKGDSLSPKEYRKTETIPIAKGCLGNCSYCITKPARGRLVSRSVEEIVYTFRDMVDANVKEILLAAQDTGCYGKDIGTSLPSLLKELLMFDGDYRIRIGMMNPDMLDSIIDDLIPLMKDNRVYKFLHIPVQSGSNPVLTRMNRKYTVNRFLGLVNRLRDEIPDISISTDMITGFPGETDREHESSLDLLRKLKADTVNITRFSPRPGTPAAEMKNQINGNVVKERSTQLTELKNIIEKENNETTIGNVYSVLVTEPGKTNGVIARTDNYRPVVVKDNIPMGERIDVEITECKSTYLIGMLLNNRS